MPTIKGYANNKSVCQQKEFASNAQVLYISNAKTSEIGTFLQVVSRESQLHNSNYYN